MTLPHTKNLLEIMAQLRDRKSGCPWDIEQNFASIAPHTIEEAYEVADAIEQKDMASLREELGDLLLQVVFHSQMANEEKLFSFEDVAESICQKLVVRHPHIFGDVEAKSADQVLDNWEAIKKQEREAKNGRAEKSALDGVTAGLPGLTRAVKLQKRAAKVGFEWENLSQVFAKLEEEIEELHHEIEEGGSEERLEDELGDIFFALSNVARHLKLDPEKALRRANNKFIRRFQALEKVLEVEGREMKSMSLEELIEGWTSVKQGENV